MPEFNSEPAQVTPESDIRRLHAYVETCRPGVASGVLSLGEVVRSMPATEIPAVRAFRAAQSGMTQEPAGGLEHGNLLLGLFGASYNPQLSLECIHFSRQTADPVLLSNYPSKAAPIVVHQSTSGLSSDRQVALFPENFKVPDSSWYGEHVFYFIDKFVRRFVTKTLPILSSPQISKRSFPTLTMATMAQITWSATSWTHLHEYFHNVGNLPFVQSYWLKSSRSTAALEELRVDVLTILEALDRLTAIGIPANNARMLAEFVLAERLLRYPAEACPSDDYDARSSVVFLSALNERGAITITDDVLEVDWQTLAGALRGLSDEIRHAEALAATSLQRDPLIALVRRYSVFSPDTKRFLRHPFHEMLVAHA